MSAPAPALLEVRDRAELRAWLEANHATSPGVSLAITRKGGTATSLTYDEAVEEGLCFGWIDSTSQALDAERQTVTFTRRRPGSAWARTNKLRVKRLMSEGRMTPAGLAVVEAAKADGSWTALDDVENLVVPADLAAALAADPAASRGFESRSASQRKLALHWIATAKREETRTRRVSEVARAAAEDRPLSGPTARSTGGGAASALHRPLQPMPPDVAAALAARGLTAAYADRPPYQRNDYLAWIGRARRDETRARRLEIMLRELEAGKGYMGMPWR